MSEHPHAKSNAMEPHADTPTHTTPPPPPPLISQALSRSGHRINHVLIMLAARATALG